MVARSLTSSLTIGDQEAQDLVAFKDLCAEETIEPQVSGVETNLIICYCSEICCFVFLLACTGQLESKPLRGLDSSCPVGEVGYIGLCCCRVFEQFSLG